MNISESSEERAPQRAEIERTSGARPRAIKAEFDVAREVIDLADCLTPDRQRRRAGAGNIDRSVRLANEPRQHAVADAHDGLWP
jgi:hypothetical protein